MKTIELIQNRSLELERKRVAAYARVSVDTDVLMYSINSQIDYFKNLIQKNRMWVFAGVFYDEGISGTSTDRPGFRALMEECEKGRVDIILIKSISRFARNTLDLLESVRRLKGMGVDVMFEKENISTLSIDGKLILTLLAFFAEEESHSISQNTRWAIRKRFEKGLECGGHALYGYRKDKEGNYRIVESEAEVVCSECGRSYRRRNNESSHYWKCAGKLEHSGCKSKNIKEELLYKLCEGHIGMLEKVVVFSDRLVIKTN